MKSISIVYKRQAKDFSSQKNLKNPTRRSIDQYYTKISEFQMKKQQLYEKIRTQTARAAKIRDKARVFSSLNIQSIGTQKTIDSQPQSERQSIWPKIKQVNLKKNENNFFAIKLPEHNQANFVEEMKLRIQDHSKHSKIKVIGKVRNNKQTTVVLSVDFILNELNFWDEEEIEEGAVKPWKTLMPLANIIWLVKRQNSAKKLVMFAKAARLRLDGIIQIERAKKQSLNISYQNLEKSLRADKKNKILIVNSLNINTLNDVSELEFKSTLPLINHGKSFVHFVKIDMGDKNRFSSVLKVLAKQLPSPVNISQILDLNEKKEKPVENKQGKKEYESYFTNQEMLEQMEKIKLRMLKQFDQSIGLTTKVEGDSVQFLVGDMLRRNFKFFTQFYNNSSSSSPRLRLRLSKSVNSRPIYNRPIYLWDF